MKNLLLALLLLVGFAAQAETNWVIAHTGYNVATIYALEGSGSDISVSTYHVENPTTGTLKNIGLPEYLWPELGNSRGVFDTRLIELNNQKAQFITEIEDLRYQLRELEGESSWRLICLLLVSIVVVGLGIALINKQTLNHKK